MDIKIESNHETFVTSGPQGLESVQEESDCESDSESQDKEDESSAICIDMESEINPLITQLILKNLKNSLEFEENGGIVITRLKEQISEVL